MIGDNELDELQNSIGYHFKDSSLLLQALTHSSYANENKSLGVQCNERLEFLGDSVLGFVVANELYRRFPDRPEGEMTRMRADMVCETTLAQAAERYAAVLTDSCGIPGYRPVRITSLIVELILTAGRQESGTHAATHRLR